MNVQLSCLGRMGRFGNQLHQYAYGRAFAERQGATLQTPEWMGQDLFCLHDPPIQGKGFELNGYFQSQQHIQTLSRAKLRNWFTFRQQWCEMFPPRKTPYAVAHLRRGDYEKYQNVYCLVSEESYTQAMKQHRIDMELVWVKEPANQGPFDFLRDFFLMIDATVLLRANSTFSWWAAVLGDAKVYSPVVENKVGPQTVPFVEGNHPMLVHPGRTGGEGGDLFLPD